MSTGIEHALESVGDTALNGRVTTTTDALGATHPILGFARAVGRGLDRVGQVDPLYMATADKKAALLELHSAEQRLTALRMRLMAVADDVPVEEGAQDVAVWLAHHTRTERGRNTSALRLGEALGLTDGVAVLIRSP